jgi:hypothetical protein
MTAMVKSVDNAALFWDGLAQELAAWQASGRRASFWWRDDDAVAASPALERLAGLSAAAGAPLAIAAIPKLIKPSLAPALAGHSTVWLLQHGFAHIDHAKGLVDPERGGRRLGARLAPADGDRPGGARGRAGDHAGRIRHPVPAGGGRPLESYRSSPDAGASRAGLSRRFLLWRAAALPAAAGLRRGEYPFRRLELEAGRPLPRRGGGAGDDRRPSAPPAAGRGGADEPTGIVTHHAALDEASWKFMAELLGFVARHPAAQWLSPGEIFTPAGVA